MHKCAETNDLAGFSYFLGGLHPEPIDSKDRWGNTCLILASERGYWQFVKAVLKEGANPGETNAKGQTAMHAAVIGGHLKVVKALYEAGASVLERDNTGALPAHYAAQADNATMLCALLQCQDPGDDKVETRLAIFEGTMNNGMTPAHSAAVFDSPKALEYLHSLGCDLERRDHFGETCAHKAARFQALAALEVLRRLGVDGTARNIEGDTPNLLERDILRTWLVE